MRPDDIVAYTYRADLYCPVCIREVFLAIEPSLVWHDTETLLDVAAEADYIDREDERSFDSGDFPKVVFRDQVSPGDSCGSCGRNLKEVV